MKNRKSHMTLTEKRKQLLFLQQSDQDRFGPFLTTE